LFFAAQPGTPQWISSARLEAFVSEWATSDWLLKGRDPRGTRLVPRKDARFLTDLDEFTPKELENEPYYQDFLRSHGLGWCVGTAIHSPSGDTLVFSIERRYDRGPVEMQRVTRLDRLRPHLARAALFSARQGLKRARATVQILSDIGLPAAVLARGGRMVAANTRLENMRPQLRFLAHDRLSFGDRHVRAMFDAALAELTSTAGATVKSLAVPAVDDNPAAVAHLLPVKRTAHDLFQRAEAVLIVTPLLMQEAPAADLLSGLFDLTPREARVARALTEGKSIADLSQSLGLSRETLRSQLKSVFAKTGTARQSELVSLLAGASLVRRNGGE
jgi:DNA-binding CsgD family transcriptional regulator